MTRFVFSVTTVLLLLALAFLASVSIDAQVARVQSVDFAYPLIEPAKSQPEFAYPKGATMPSAPYAGERLVVIYSEAGGCAGIGDKNIVDISHPENNYREGCWRNVVVEGGRRFYINIMGTAWETNSYGPFTGIEQRDGTCVEWKADIERYKEVTC